MSREVETASAGTCTLCGQRAPRRITPYWDDDAALCPRCARVTALDHGVNGTWPPVPWETT